MSDIPETKADPAGEISPLPEKKRRRISWVKALTLLGIVVVLTCFILPDMYRARIVGNISRSNANLKQLGRAVKQYNAAFGQLPMGTVPNSQLKSDERLSWIVSLLPYLDQAPLYNQINQEKSWNAPLNAPYTSTSIPMLLNPGQTNVPRPDGFGVTHYIGVAGVGEDAATSPPYDKLGAFGYDRKVRINDITDGLSNTIIIAEALPDFGPWAQGGTSTIRVLTAKPYLNDPHNTRIQVLLGDGAVRGISQQIDPAVFEAHLTIHGNEIVGGF